MGLRRINRALHVGALLCVPLVAHASVPGFTPQPGWEAELLDLSADVIAIAPDGRLATGASSASGASITVYNQAAPEGRAVVASVTAPDLRSLGGLAFIGDSLLVSENGTRDTVYRASLPNGSVIPLAPAGSVPNVAEVGVRPGDGAVFAVSANNPGAGVVYRFNDGAALPFAAGLGVGYLGGLDFDEAGNLLVADTNDPFFTGASGRVLQLSDTGAVAGALDLTGGGGSGVYDITWSNGALYATTGATLTRWEAGAAEPFGTFAGAFPFPTDIAAAPDGSVIVNGIYTEAGGLFALRPSGTAIPEPGTLALLGLGLVSFAVRRSRPGR